LLCTQRRIGKIEAMRTERGGKRSTEKTTRILEGTEEVGEHREVSGGKSCERVVDEGRYCMTGFTEERGAATSGEGNEPTRTWGY